MSPRKHARLREHQARRKSARKWRKMYEHRLSEFIRNYRVSLSRR